MKYFKAAFENCELNRGVEIVAIEYDDGIIMVTEKKKDKVDLDNSFQYSTLYNMEQVLKDYVDSGATIVDKKL